MDDVISRQAEIDAIDVLKRNYPASCFEDLRTAVDIAIKALYAQAEQKTGEWLDGEVSYEDTVMQVIVCDQCLAFFPLQFGDSHNYCPNCGAKMEVKDAD